MQRLDIIGIFAILIFPLSEKKKHFTVCRFLWLGGGGRRGGAAGGARFAAGALKRRRQARRARAALRPWRGKVEGEEAGEQVGEGGEQSGSWSWCSSQERGREEGGRRRAGAVGAALSRSLQGRKMTIFQKTPAQNFPSRTRPSLITKRPSSVLFKTSSTSLI